MPTRTPDAATPRTQLEAMGKAIRAMRRAAGPLGSKITTAEAGRRAGLSRQTWENYEKAHSQLILRQDVQDQIAKALGITRQDLEAEQRRQMGDASDNAPRGVEEAGRGLAFVANAAARQLQMPDDTLRPWGRSGMTVVYDRNLWPTPDEGVVLENAAGDRFVKIFGHLDADHFHVYELYPEPKALKFPRAEFEAYRVVARIG